MSTLGIETKRLTLRAPKLTGLPAHTAFFAPDRSPMASRMTYANVIRAVHARCTLCDSLQTTSRRAL